MIIILEFDCQLSPFAVIDSEAEKQVSSDEELFKLLYFNSQGHVINGHQILLL